MLSLLNRVHRTAQQIGLLSLIELFFRRRYSLLTLNIDGIPITVRKGTPDLQVAITSLTGEFEMLRFLLPRDYSGCIIDGGGYIGTAAIALHRLYPSATIISIEPSKNNIEILEMNTSRIPEIYVIHGALVGSDHQTVDLFDPGEREWGLTTEKKHLGIRSASVMETVPAINLNDLVFDHGQIGILKLDIEGGELDVLERSEVALLEIYAIYVELHNRFVEGSEKAFWDSSKDRIVVKDSGEKYLSIRKCG